MYIYIYMYISLYIYTFLYIYIYMYVHMIHNISSLYMSYCLPLSLQFGRLHPEVFLQDLPGRWRQGQLEADAPEALITQGQDLGAERMGKDEILVNLAAKYRSVCKYVYIYIDRST